MADFTIYTRAYCEGSTGTLVSRRGPGREPLSQQNLLNEFRNHSNKKKRIHTALVSVSNRIVDTVKRAFDLHYEREKSPDNIWIAFIKVPAGKPALMHKAQFLAKKCGLKDSSCFQHEFVFEWAIPEEYVSHQVSLRTLMDRGLEHQLPSITELPPPTTEELRHFIATKLGSVEPWLSSWESGVCLGSFARNFGARAPLNWIAHQLFRDCVRVCSVSTGVARLVYEQRHSDTVSTDFFCHLDEGVETVLYDWWLTDIEFLSNYDEFKQWRDAMEESMSWECIDFVELWEDTCHPSPTKEDLLSYDEAWHELRSEHEKLRATIEARAVQLGL